MTARTPGPWLKSAAGPTVYALHGDPLRNRFSALVQGGRRDDATGDELEANAQFIVRACNNHDALVAALEWALDQIDDDLDPDHQIAFNAARAALAAAKGTP